MSWYWLFIVLALGASAELPEIQELRNEMMNMRRDYDMKMMNMRHQYENLKVHYDMEIADLKQQIQGKQQHSRIKVHFAATF